MPEAISQVESRIRHIQSLLGETPVPNEAFDETLAHLTSEPATERRTVAAIRSLPAAVRPLNAASPAATPPSLQSLIDTAAGRTGLPAELISAVMATESGFQPNAVSPVGAQGLMQLMPATARSLGVTDPLDPLQNVLGGAEYLRQQLEHFGSVEKALAAYNAGPGAVEKHGGIPPYPETRNYVERIMDRLRQGSQRAEP